MERLNTGWRKAAPVIPVALPEECDTDRTELFTAGRLAVEALNLRSACRHVLDQLIGCYRGEPIQGRLLVWPSNDFLERRTGLAERTIRAVLSNLIAAGVISSKDSANGKRYARRSRSGQIIDAYGLDLAPLLARKREFFDRVAEIKAEIDRRKTVFDEITICRRSTREILLALIEWQQPTDALQRAFDAECDQTPRRDVRVAPDASLARWRALHLFAQEQYLAASGGNSCRHKENNNDSPDQSCNNGQGMNEGPVSLVDLAAACPEAFGYAEKIANERELVGAAARLRGTIGIHESAWEEAREKLGPVPAAAAFFVVLQRYDRDQNGTQSIKNPGGYFRNYIRLIAGGQIDLKEEIRGMRRRRSH